MISTSSNDVIITNLRCHRPLQDEVLQSAAKILCAPQKYNKPIESSLSPSHRLGFIAFYFVLLESLLQSWDPIKTYNRQKWQFR